MKIGNRFFDTKNHTYIMGILNVTPDSFYSGSRMQTEEDIAARARQILDEGASIIDIGAYSSRANAEHISAEEEMRRLRTGLDTFWFLVKSPKDSLMASLIRFILFFPYPLSFMDPRFFK